MNTEAEPEAPASSRPKTEGQGKGAFNVPNLISLARVVLGAVALVLIAVDQFAWSLILFLIASLTDTLDGYLARKLDQETVLGRQLDPLIDKLLIAAVLIFLVAEPNSGVWPWMAAVIICRELVVQWLRSLMEGQGVAFGAKQAGKLKTVLQCSAIVASLLGLSLLPEPAGWVLITRDVLWWATLIATLYSGAGYVVAAWPRIGHESE